MIKDLPHYWINLSSNSDRADFMRECFRKSDVVNIRVDATSPKTLPRCLLPPGHKSGNSLVEYACLASHLKAIKLAYESGVSAALILEDDMSSLTDYQYSAIADSAPPDWEVLQLFTSNINTVTLHHTIYSKHKILWQLWDINNWSAGAYLINRAGMSRIMDRFFDKTPGAGNTLDFRATLKYTKLVSDYMIFRFLNAYTCTYPLFVNHILPGFAIHAANIESRHMPLREKVLSIHNSTSAPFGG